MKKKYVEYNRENPEFFFDSDDLQYIKGDGLSKKDLEYLESIG